MIQLQIMKWYSYMMHAGTSSPDIVCDSIISVTSSPFPYDGFSDTGFGSVPAVGSCHVSGRFISSVWNVNLFSPLFTYRERRIGGVSQEIPIFCNVRCCNATREPKYVMIH